MKNNLINQLDKIYSEILGITEDENDSEKMEILELIDSLQNKIDEVL